MRMKRNHGVSEPLPLSGISLQSVEGHNEVVAVSIAQVPDEFAIRAVGDLYGFGFPVANT